MVDAGVEDVGDDAAAGNSRVVGVGVLGAGGVGDGKLARGRDSGETPRSFVLGGCGAVAVDLDRFDGGDLAG